MTNKNVQIPESLFFELVRYHILEQQYDDLLNAKICQALQQKVDKLAAHENYKKELKNEPTNRES